jgi:hypothetical protein
MNKLMKKVLDDIESEVLAWGRTPIWTNLLGRAMAAVNNPKGRDRYSETAYNMFLDKIIISMLCVRWPSFMSIPPLWSTYV